MPAARHDLIILGGGLAGGLSALTLKAARPDLDIALVEPGPIGGNHLWSFFESDVAAADIPLVEPLVGHCWRGHVVRFPAHRRRLGGSYRTIESEALARAVRAALPADRMIARRATAASPNSVTFDQGETRLAGAVLDARGLSEAPVGLRCGWQKFAGQTLVIPTGHGLDCPIVMDACVEQSEGYRFVYCLPLSPIDLFVEDTYYSDSPDLDTGRLERRIAAYAATQGWAVSAVTRRESGVLPVLMDGDFDAFWPATDCLARAGVRAGLFHPLTSFSLPDAARFANWLAKDAPLNARLGVAARDYAQQHWHRGRFDRLLARMLLRAADPPQRFRILERFYRLPEPLIARFYAGRSTFADRLRILAGKPPVAIGRAIAAIRESK